MSRSPTHRGPPARGTSFIVRIDSAATLPTHSRLLPDFIQRLAGADPVEAHLTITADGERYIAFDNSPLARTPLPDHATIDAALAKASALLVDATSAPEGSIDVA